MSANPENLLSVCIVPLTSVRLLVFKVKHILTCCVGFDPDLLALLRIELRGKWGRRMTILWLEKAESLV